MERGHDAHAFGDRPLNVTWSCKAADPDALDVNPIPVVRTFSSTVGAHSTAQIFPQPLIIGWMRPTDHNAHTCTHATPSPRRQGEQARGAFHVLPQRAGYVQRG